MITNTRLPLITKVSQKLFISTNEPQQNLKNLRYIPDWFIKREPCGNYNDFMEKLEKFYPNMSLKKLTKFVKKKGQKIGEGRHAEAYTIPKIDNYVLRINKKTSLNLFSKVKKLKKTPDNYYGFNFGQPIADNGNGISINIKVVGEEYGIKNWFESIKKRNAPTERQANKFIQYHLAQLSEFPQSSFDDFIKKVSFIKNATPYSFDFINPNNFVIDYKNKRINIVDTCLKNEENFLEPNISKIPLTLCDMGTLFYASPKAYEDSTEYTHKIMKKCGLAISKYRDSYPRLGWDNEIETDKKTSSRIQKFIQNIKKFLDKKSQNIRAKHFGNFIENLNN